MPDRPDHSDDNAGCEDALRGVQRAVLEDYIAPAIAKAVKEEPANQLEKPAQRFERALMKAIEGIDAANERLARGVEVICSHPGLQEEIFGSLESDDIAAKMQDVPRFIENFEDGVPVQELLGVTDAHLQSIYRVGQEEYGNEAYQRAVDVFYFLCVLNGSFADVWLSLGRSLMMLQRYDEAVAAFSVITYVDKTDQRAYFAMADGLIRAGKIDTAKAILELALEDLEGEEKLAAEKRITEFLIAAGVE